MSAAATKTVRVTNIAPQATRDQMQTLFGFIGKIDDIRLYPTVRDVAVPVVSRVSFIRFADPLLADVAQHMTNTVFIDRALIVMPFHGDIPEEAGAMEALRQDNGHVGVLNDGELPSHVTNVIEGAYYITRDPSFAENGIPDYPDVSCTLEYGEVEEIRRTIMVGNLPPETETAKLVDLMSAAGEVKYARMCGRSSDESRACLLEFCEQASVLAALKMAGTEYRGRALTMAHSRLPILKPQIKTNEMAQREIKEAMLRTQEQQTLMTPSTQPQTSYMDQKRRSRTRSPGRRSSRSEAYRAKRRSRSRDRGRRSRSRDRKRSRSRDRRRSRSKDRARRSRSRDRRRSRSRGHKRSRSRERRRSRSRERRRSRSRERRDRAKARRSRSKEKKSSSSRDKRGGGSREREPRAASQSAAGGQAPADTSDVEVPLIPAGATAASMALEKRSSRSVSPKQKHSRSRSPAARKSSRRSRSRSRGHRRSRSPHLSRKRSRSPRGRRSPDRSSYRRERKAERHASRDRPEGRASRRVVRDYDEEEAGYDEHEAGYDDQEAGSAADSPPAPKSSKYGRSSRKRADPADMSE